jgi:hypothetical protein
MLSNRVYIILFSLVVAVAETILSMVSSYSGSHHNRFVLDSSWEDPMLKH